MVLAPFYLSLVILAGLICFVNFIFVILVYTRGSARKLQNALLISLGCSDFCVGFLAIPSILLCNLVIPPNCQLCVTSFLVHRLISISSALNLLAVIYERYVKIIHPYWFQDNEFRLLRSSRVIPALWLTSFVLAATPLSWLLLETPCPGERSLRYLEYYDRACLAFVILLVILMIYAFLRIFLVVRTHLHGIRATAVQNTVSEETAAYSQSQLSVDTATKGIAAGSPNSSFVRAPEWESGANDLNCLTGNAMRSQSGSLHYFVSSGKSGRHYLLLKEARVVSRFAAMVVLFILVWGVYFFLSLTEQNGEEIGILVKKIFTVLRFTNSLINPWIFIVNNKDFQYTWKVFPACFLKLAAFCRNGKGRRKCASNRNSSDVEKRPRTRMLHVSSV